jgi:CRISPR-associated protein Cas1
MTVVKYLIADRVGSFVGKYSERLKVTYKGDVIQQAPLIHLRSVTLIGNGVSISSDAIAECAERGIPIILLDHSGHVTGALYSAGLVGTIATRREQILAYYDGRGALLAQSFTFAKLTNQVRTLLYWAHNRERHHPDDAAQLRATAQEITAIIERMQTEWDAIAPELIAGWLMGWEGQAAHLYWQVAEILVPPAYGWSGRVGRGALDPVNSLLNYGYGILYGEIERAVLLGGLDPYAGFLHADRPGKPSLVLDLIEEFRQIAVDRVVFGLVARNYTIERDENGRLSLETRRDFIDKIRGQLEGYVHHAGKRGLLRHAIQRQARRLASYLRRESTEYIPYLMED